MVEQLKLALKAFNIHFVDLNDVIDARLVATGLDLLLLSLGLHLKLSGLLQVDFVLGDIPMFDLFHLTLPIIRTFLHGFVMDVGELRIG